MTEQDEENTKFDLSQIKIKEEKFDYEVEKKLNPDLVVPQDDGGTPEPGDEVDDKKKVVEPVKSSNEILAELFSVFNARPPAELLDDENLIKRVKRKKEKKHKKKSKKSKHSNDHDSNSEDSEKSHSHRHKHKRKKHKKEKSREKEVEAPIVDVKVESSRVPVPEVAEESTRKDKDSHRSRVPSRHKSSKGDSDISLSDEETFLQEKKREGSSFYDSHHERKYSHRSSRTDFYSNYDKVRSERRHRDRRDRQRSRTRTRSRSRSPHLNIDKKRLLETARKNVISMFKNGSLPGCVGMSDEIKDKVLLKMRYGGKTVQDLTDFCKKLSNGEGVNDLSDLSPDDDSDHDRDGNSKAFHHPFVMKEREPIVMHIRNSKAIPPKTADQSKAIQLFPVSSGQQHRMTEEWIPVPPGPPAPKPAQPSLPKPPPSAAKPKNVFEKALPSEKQEPAFKPNKPTDAPATEAQPEPDSTTVSAAPESTAPLVSVFPTEDKHNFDVSTIISKRLNAMRRLQDNPMDSEAIKMMYNSQKEMTSWASSKFTPGQFTGSTGANVLSARELTGGYQAWARKDQLTATTPVTGGMGMHLLKKMGWKEGEGLGREKNGALQPLLLDVKLDKRGLVANEETKNKQNIERNKKKAGNAAALDQNKHPVCLLNELAAKRRWLSPAYELVHNDGPCHNKSFMFTVNLNGVFYKPSSVSNTKKEAKMHAARYCLQQIGVLPM